MATARVSPRTKSQKVKPTNQLTLEKRVKRVEAQQKNLHRQMGAFLDRIGPIFKDIQRVQKWIVGRMKAKRLAAKAGGGNG